MVPITKENCHWYRAQLGAEAATVVEWRQVLDGSYNKRELSLRYIAVGIWSCHSCGDRFLMVPVTKENSHWGRDLKLPQLWRPVLNGYLLQRERIGHAKELSWVLNLPQRRRILAGFCNKGELRYMQGYHSSRDIWEKCHWNRPQLQTRRNEDVGQSWKRRGHESDANI